MRLLLALTCTATLAFPLQAQTVQRQAQVYRCGPDGRDLRDSPCAGPGAASGPSPVIYDEPSAADRRAAREQHLADARQVAALAAERRATEAQARQQRALRLGSAPAAPVAPTAPASAATPHTAKPPKLARPHRPARPHPAASGSTQASR